MANVQTCWKRNGHSKGQKKTCPLVLSGGQVLESAEDEGINILFVCGPFIIAAADGVPDCVHTPIELEVQKTDQLIITRRYSPVHDVEIFFPVHGNKFTNDGMNDGVVRKQVAQLWMGADKYAERDTFHFPVTEQLCLNTVYVQKERPERFVQDFCRVAEVLVEAGAADARFLT